MMNSPAPWTDAVIESVRDVTPTVREFLLRPGAGAAVYAPGAHLEVQLSVHGGLQTRSYSLVGAPDGHRYRIAVKCLPQGRGGSLAMWSLAPGDTLPLRGPRNSFPLALDAPQYLLVGGGIGVTPMVFMAQTLAARGAQVRMLLAARGSEELAYADTLRTALGNSLHTFADDQGERPDFAREVATLLPGALLLCCGPAGLLAAVGFEIFKQVASIYLRVVLHGPAGTVFGPVLGLMVFAYMTARLVLFATAWAATDLSAPAPVDSASAPPRSD